MGIITFDGKTSNEFNVVVEVFPNYTVPEKEYQSFSIPGRNGSVIVDTGVFKNVERSYEIAIADPDFVNDFSAMVNPVAEWLLSPSGYAKLEDSYDDKYYRLATYVGGTDINNLYNVAGRCTLTFDCKPEKYLKSGSNITSFTKNGTITNPTKFESKPLIKIYGSGEGSIDINNKTVRVKNIAEHVYIDSDSMDCYKDSTNQNGNVILTNGFPILAKGTNTITLHDGVTKLEVIPRWWTI